MELKDMLRRLLLERGVEASELAREVGMSRQALTNLLTGRTKRPQNKTLNKIAKYFNIAPEELLGLGAEGRQVPEGYVTTEEFAAFKKKLENGGLNLNNIKLDPYQLDRLRKKYINAEGGIFAFHTRVDHMTEEDIETILRAAFWIEEINKRIKLRTGNGAGKDSGEEPDK